MRAFLLLHYSTLFYSFSLFSLANFTSDFSVERKHFYRNKVKSMFYHAYNGYLENAYPKDELKPITCTGQDTWGGYSLTLIDSLDMLLIMGNTSEFMRATDLVLERLEIDRNMNISVFETNIRVIGGLLSAHMLSSHAQEMYLPDGWPCSGPLLDLAEKFAQKLLPAFNTDTGMPFGTVNLRYGVNKLETPVTCTAGIGTFILEFGTLSRLTGNPHYERVALKALDSLWASRSKLGLVGNHIDVQTGVFTAVDSGIGAGVDSYFEYLVKGALLFQRPELMQQFYELEEAINKHVRKEDWFMWVDKDKATVSLPIFQSLEAFWPGLLTLVGKVEDAARVMSSYMQVLKHLGLPPEFYNLPNREPVQRRAAYPLRPEMAESLMYLYRATRDPAYLHAAAGMVDTIEQLAKTKCGYATVRDVTTWTLEDRMESFFLAETTKYLYLLFDEHNFMHGDGSEAKLVETTNGPCLIEAGGWIFNTEAHPLDPAIVHCCSAKRSRDQAMLQQFEENIDLLALTGLYEKNDLEMNADTQSYERREENEEFPEDGREEENTQTFTIFCPECCTPLDAPNLTEAARSFWHAIYTRHYQYLGGEICGVDEDEEDRIADNYFNSLPDLNTLDSKTQQLDAVQRVSLHRFKYVRPGWELAENFTLLTTPSQPFERMFMGIGQIVRV